MLVLLLLLLSRFRRYRFRCIISQIAQSSKTVECLGEQRAKERLKVAEKLRPFFLAIF